MSQTGKFGQPDHTGDPGYFVRFLEITDHLPQIEDVRDRNYRLMNLRPGGRVLDVGSGRGTAVQEMANFVGSEGLACGVDISDTMTAEATARAQGRSNIQFLTGNTYALPYPDNTFDAVRMERVLLYVDDREKAVQEMMRVAKPGGYVVVTDTDFDCNAITGKDPALTRRITSLIADTFAHANSGRELPAVLRSAGLQDLTIEVVAVPSPYELCLHQTRGTLESAIQTGKITEKEVDEWYRGIAELEASGDFLQLFFFVIVRGTVPGSN